MMDRWQSLRDKLAEGPDENDEQYFFQDTGELALWVTKIRADYLQGMLDEIDELRKRLGYDEAA